MISEDISNTGSGTSSCGKTRSSLGIPVIHCNPTGLLVVSKGESYTTYTAYLNSTRPTCKFFIPIAAVVSQLPILYLLFKGRKNYCPNFRRYQTEIHKIYIVDFMRNEPQKIARLFLTQNSSQLFFAPNLSQPFLGFFCAATAFRDPGNEAAELYTRRGAFVSSPPFRISSVEYNGGLPLLR